MPTARSSPQAATASLWKQRAAGEQEAAVAAGGAARDGSGVHAGHGRAGLERAPHCGEARAAEADDAEVHGDGAAQRPRVLRAVGIAPDGRGEGRRHAPGC